MKAAISNYERAVTSFDVIFNGLEPPATPSGELTNLLNEANVHRKNLIDTIGLFAGDPNEVFTEAMKNKATTYCTHFTNKIKLMYVQIKQNDEAEARHAAEQYTRQANQQQAAAVDQRGHQAGLCAQRVTRMLPSIQQTVNDLNTKFTTIRLHPATAALELKGLENSFKQNCDLMAEAARQIDDLTRNATTANDQLSLETLDGLLVSLTKSKRDTRGRLDDLHKSLGILPGMIDSGVKGIQVEAPTFSGKFSDEPDYFTFCKRLTEYFSQAGSLSAAQKLLKLRSDCLRSPAKECVANANSYEVAIHILKTHFGKPTMVFITKAQELKSCGKCPVKIIEKRNWIFNVTQKIKALYELAQDHGLGMMFESTNIVGVLQKLMLPKDHEEFKKTLREEMKAKP